MPFRCLIRRASSAPITIASPSHWLPSKPIAAAGFWTRCVTLPSPERDGSRVTLEVYACMAEARMAEAAKTKEGWGARMFRAPQTSWPPAPSCLMVHQPLVHFRRQGLNPLTQFLNALGQHQILFQQRQYLGTLLEGEALLLRACGSEGLAVLDVGFGVDLIAVGLPRLRQQDERRRIGRLRAEGQVQQNKRIQVKLRHSSHVEGDPDCHKECLGA